MCFIHLCRQCCCLCSSPVFSILQHNRLTQDQPFSLQSTHFSCLLGGLHLCSPPLAQPSTGDLACSPNPSWSLFLSYSLLNVGLHLWGEMGTVSAILLKTWSQTLCFPQVLSVTFGRSCLGTSANLHMLLVSENCSNPALVREVLRPGTGHVPLSSSCLTFCLSCNFCSVPGQLRVP